MSRGAVGAGAVRWLRAGDSPEGLVEALRRGAVAAVPTESSYGLAVDPLDAGGVAKIFRIKGREGGKPLPVVISGTAALPRLGIDPGSPEVAWAARRWPAPLSVLAPLREPIPASAGRTELAVRVPAHARLRELAEAAGGALTATSANPSGEPPYLEPEGVAAWLAGLGVAAVVVDGGELPGGAPSTLVRWREGKIETLRPGRYELE